MNFNALKFKDCGGIYKITNKVNGKSYIGRTKCFNRRFYQYVRGFKYNDSNYINRRMLNSINKHGWDSFVFRIIEVCETESHIERENFWMSYFNSHEAGYNLRKDTLGGMEVHPRTSKKISKRLKEEWSSGIRDQHSEKLKKSWEGRDRDEQSRLMSKTLTKYTYLVSKDGVQLEVNYQGLVGLELTACLSGFFKKKTDIVNCKGFVVERVRIDDT